MDDTILDENEKPNLRIYYNKSKKNLKISTISIVITILLILAFPSLAWGPGIILYFLPILIAGIAAIIGLINGIKSYTNNETHSANRIFILIGNLIIAILFLILIFGSLMAANHAVR